MSIMDFAFRDPRFHEVQRKIDGLLRIKERTGQANKHCEITEDMTVYIRQTRWKSSKAPAPWIRKVQQFLIFILGWVRLPIESL